jgi:UDP-N-acetylglucosamine--N-acetylmuramyl-(pentapeptide) pyrophosphoryl-undecaprenol N-acetylglucosamine transferase
MIILVTGGTGGHVFPAVALRDILLKNNKDVQIIIDQRGAQFVQNDKSVHIVPIYRSLRSVGKLIYPFSLFSAFLKSFVFFLKNRPTLVIGFGGYTTVPSLVAAFILRIPIIIQEANSFLGKGNRFLQKISTCICTSFPNTKTDYPKKTHCLGLPLRQVFFEKEFDYIPPNLEEKFHILIIGGSQGAKIFSDLIPKAISLLEKDQQKRIIVRQQARPEYINHTQALYRDISSTVEIKPFFADMPAEYAWAHLVITRSGASTLFELARTKRPAILVPFHSSIEGDQQKNAEAFEAQNACWVFSEKQLTAQKMAEHIRHLMENSNMLIEKSEAIANLCNTNIEKDFLNIF